MNDFQGAFGDLVQVGSPFEVSYTFDSLTPDSRPLQAGWGDYQNPIQAITGHVGFITFGGAAGLPSGISVRDGTTTFGGDSYFVRSLDVATPLVGEPSDLLLGLDDPSGLAFGSDALPVSLNFSRFAAGFSFVTSSELLAVGGDITGFVPEPGSVLLLAAGVAGVLGGRCVRSEWGLRFSRRNGRTRAAVDRRS